MAESAIPVIDLTSVDTSDEEDNNCLNYLEDDSIRPRKIRVMKFTFVKKTRASRLQIVRPGVGEKIHLSLFSDASKNHFNDLQNESKRTYVGESRNPFLGNALFAAELIEPGDFICLYLGLRIPRVEADAIIDAGGSAEYMLDVTQDVVIDGAGVGIGAAMANHSCSPNAELQHDYLKGYDRAPIGLLRALERIEVGDEIEANYHMFDPAVDVMPDLSDLDAYVPCKCLRPNCIRVFRLNE